MNAINIYLQNMAFGQKEGQVFCSLCKSDMSIFGAHLITAEEAVSILEGAEHYKIIKVKTGIMSIVPVPADPERVPRSLEHAFVAAFSAMDMDIGGDSYADCRGHYKLYKGG